MIPYVCKDPTCNQSTAWHLINGDLDCIDMNRAAVAEFARMVEEPLMITVAVSANGYVDHANVIAFMPEGVEPVVPTPDDKMEM